MKRLVVVFCVLLSGCATCERHKVACGVGAALLAGAAAAAVEASSDSPQHHAGDPNCGTGVVFGCRPIG